MIPLMYVSRMPGARNPNEVFAVLKTNTVSSSEYQGREILRKKIKRKQWIGAIIRALKSMLMRIEVGYSSSSC